MLFAALNKKTRCSEVAIQSSQSETTREAQESVCLQRYHEAIRLQQEGDGEKARAVYLEILGSKVMDEADISSGTVMMKIKFLSFKNLGSIARCYGDHSTALDAFIQAVEVDRSEVTVWYHLAQAAVELGNLLLARTALEEGRRCQTLYWPVINLLSSVLFALDDFSECLKLINEVLPHAPDFPRGLTFLHHIATLSPDLLTFAPRLRIHLMKPHPPDSDKFIDEAKQLAKRCGLLSEVKVLEEPIKPQKPMTYYSLYSLGQGLLALYHYCKERSSLSSPIDLALLHRGTTDKPLLPTLVTQTTFTSSEEVSGEEGGGGGGGGGGGERKEYNKRKIAPDMSQGTLPKRRSNRVKSRREQVSATERFARFLPDHLRGCEFGDVSSLSPLPESKGSILIDQSDCSVINPLRLSSDIVKTYLHDNQNNCGVIRLVYNYLSLLSLHYNYLWSEASFSVVRLFVELYELIKKHLIFPSPLCSPSSPDYTSVQDIAMITICYCELKLDTLQRTSSRSSFPPPLLQALSFSQLAGGHVGWRGYSEFSLRVKWCKYKMKMMEEEMETALAIVRECHNLLENEDCLSQLLPNIRSENYISSSVVTGRIRSLQQVIASEEVYTLFKSGDYSRVVSSLKPMLLQHSDNITHFLLGSGGGGGGGGGDEQTPLSLLLRSLIILKDWQDCLLCCVIALKELLVTYKLGNPKWLTALNTSFSLLDRCMLEGPKGMLRECEEKVQRHLIVCVFRTLDVQVEMAESSFFHLLPLTLPWTVLYHSLPSLWDDTDVAMETSTEHNEHIVIETEANSPISVSMETEETGVVPTITINDQELMRSCDGRGLQLLCEIHDYLGGIGQGWCVGEDGQLLKILVMRLREELRLLTTHTTKTRENLLRELEQCYYCLYGHPHKKAKAWGLQDHGAEQLPLTWESAQVLLEFYHPSFLPAVEENKALTPELVSLYRRIVDILPDTDRVLTLQIIAGFIEGKLETLPLPSPPGPHTTLISEIYYLLGDDGLKSNDFLSALHNYTQSVCYCPDRVDTWAGLALARALTVLKILDRRDTRGGTETVQKQLTPILRCFKRALALGSQHHYIREKYGLFCYTVQSYCSQIVSMPDVYQGKTELLSWAERSRRGLLQLSRQCFNSAIKEVGGVRPWYYGLVVGKAGVKLGLPPSDTLPVLISVARKLGVGATLPATVELRGQGMTMVEIHYQIYCCAVKYLLRNEEGGENAVAMAMEGWEGQPLCDVEYVEVKKWLKDVLCQQRKKEDAITSLVHTVIAEAEREVALETGEHVELTSDLRKEATPSVLLIQCLYGIAVCGIRCPAYYKCWYRLASVFHRLGHSQEARKLLLGPLPHPLMKAQDKLQPLFVLKSNIFANFWQIPVEEINRPGRFSSSARSSLQLLSDVLSQHNESHSLLMLVQYLRSRPDSSRQYLRDYERLIMCQKIMRCCSSVHQRVLRARGVGERGSEEKMRCLLLETHSLRIHCFKSDNKESSLLKMIERTLVDCYNIYISKYPNPRVGVVSTKVGVATPVEEAARYCHSIARLQTEKQSII